MHSLRLSICLFVCALMVGCGSSGPAKVAVKGTVTLDEKKIPKGEIHFITSGEPPEVLQITNGAFQGEVAIGKRRVEIYAYKEVPPPPTATSEMKSSTVNYVPARYNSASELEANVVEEGANSFDYPLRSKPARRS